MAFVFGANFFSAFRGFATSQAFEELLAKEDTTIEQVLEEEDVIQETRNNNAKLMEFLTEERIENMLLYITEEPPEDADHNRAYKYPFQVSEMLSCEPPSVMEKITDSEELLERVFKFFVSDSALNLTLAGYVSKCVISLLSRSRNIVSSHILQENLYGKAMVSHVYSKSIAELLGKVLSMEDPGVEPVFIPQRLEILEAVVNSLGTSEDYDVITNATLLLVDFVYKNEGVNGWNILIARLLSREILTQMFGFLSSTNVTTVKGVVSVLNAVFNHGNFNEILQYDLEKLLAGETQQDETEDQVLMEEDTPVLMEVLVENIPTLAKFLSTETGRELPMTYGGSVKPVGETRLRLIELLTSVIKTDSDLLHKAIFESNVLLTMTDMFFLHVWNSSLHYYYNEIVQKILSMDSVYLRNHLTDTAQLPKKLLEEINETNAEAGGKYYRKGNLGYVTKISNSLVRMQSGEDEPKELCEGWQAFVGNQLQATNELENRNIGGYKPYPMDNDDPNDADYFDNQNLDRFTSHFTNEAEEVEEDIEEDFERGEPLSLDDLDSPEKKDKHDANAPKIPVDFMETAAFRPGTPLVTSTELLCSSTDAINWISEIEEDVIEYNSNMFWKPDIIDIDELEDLD